LRAGNALPQGDHSKGEVLRHCRQTGDNLKSVCSIGRDPADQSDCFRPTLAVPRGNGTVVRAGVEILDRLRLHAISTTALGAPLDTCRSGDLSSISPEVAIVKSQGPAPGQSWDTLFAERHEQFITGASSTLRYPGLTADEHDADAGGSSVRFEQTSRSCNPAHSPLGGELPSLRERAQGRLIWRTYSLMHSRGMSMRWARDYEVEGSPVRVFSFATGLRLGIPECFHNPCRTEALPGC